MDVELGGEKAAELKVQRIFPIGQEIGIICKEEHSGCPTYCGRDSPHHICLRIRTKFRSRLPRGFNVVLQMINVVGQAGLEVVG